MPAPRDILGSFNPDLRLYAERILSKSGVEVVKAQVKEVTETTVVLNDGSEIEHGLLVWSTGVGPTPFISSLPFAKSKDGRLAVDGLLRVADMEGGVVENVFSLGDCSCNVLAPLPTTAQVGSRASRCVWAGTKSRERVKSEVREREGGSREEAFADPIRSSLTCGFFFVYAARRSPLFPSSRWRSSRASGSRAT